MKKTWVVLLFLVLLGGGYDGVSAAITQRIIYAGDTPLASTCAVTQTGPMELTISACSFTTTGRAKIVHESKVSNLQSQITAGRVERMPDGKRIRGWIHDKQGNIIEKSKTHVRNVATTVTVPGPGRWVIYLLDGPGINLDVILQLWEDPRPTKYVEYIVMPFVVPVGTTDLNTIDLEIFTVLPGFPAPKGMFEK
ncbi:hypothetical protein LCGC14_2828420 [marine sediment metagenome]|uniref:Uncharacterized protein n=1 Tax=marine sediment metagenome TaxID=412755 RepID=A0A0F9ANC2_9ZZZZ